MDCAHIIVRICIDDLHLIGRKIFGGNIRVYESLLIRARREAVLRMKAAAKARGARGIFNIKFETSTIGGGKGVTSVEVIVYGTAVA